MAAQNTTDRAELVTLSPEALADLLGLPAEDGFAIIGSAVRVPAAWIEERRTRVGTLDLTFADCALLTGTPVATFNGWRNRGLLQVRALGTSRNNALRVAPAELVRVLRLVAQQRNGTTAATETPTQQARRGAKAREAALRACAGE